MERFKTGQMKQKRQTIKTNVALARIMGVAERTVSNWKAAGLPVEVDGSFDLEKIDAWLEERKSKKAPNPASEFWSTEFRKFKALLVEAEYNEIMDRLISSEKVKREQDARYLEFKTRLVKLCKEAPALVIGKGGREIQWILTEMTFQALRDLAKGPIRLQRPKK